MKRLNVFLLLLILISLMPIPLTARPMGQVRALAGEVYARSSGKWVRLDNPRLLYSADKLYTKQGRTELNLDGGGIVQLDAWTSITLKDGGDNENPAPTIRVVTGNAWFDLQKRVINLDIRTPHANVVTSGSSGQVMTNLRNGTEIGFRNRGISEVSGNYKNFTPTVPSNLQGPIEGLGPQGDMVIHNSLNDVIQAHREANRLLMWDSAERIRSRKIFYRELSQKSLSASETLSKRVMEAALSRSEASQGVARAHFASMQAQLTEDDLMGDNANVKKIQDLMRDAERDQDTIFEDAKEIREHMNDGRNGMDAQGFINATSAAVIANRSIAKAELIHIKSLLGMTDKKSESMIRTVLDKATRYANRVDPLLLNMEKIDNLLSSGGSNSHLLLALSAMTTRNSADIISGCISGLAGQAGEVSKGNGVNDSSCRFTSTAQMASDKAVSALSSGDAGGVVDALRTTEEAIKNSGRGMLAGGISGIPDVYGTPIVDQLDVAGEAGGGQEEGFESSESELAREEGIEEPLISPHDLATASPSQ